MAEKERGNKEQMGQTEIKQHNDRFKPTISIITLSENGLKTSIKKQIVRDFTGGAVVESLPANAGDVGSGPGLGGSHMLRSN